MTVQRIVALHGFLGLGEDWEPVRASIEDMAPGLEFVAVDLWALAGLPMDEAAEKINTMGDGETLLVGYSMGGRLAAMVMSGAQCSYAGAIIVSGHFGGLEEAEAQTRRESDRRWAKRFAADPWNQVVGDWNAQPIFASDGVVPLRSLKRFNRSNLASVMYAWSVSGQPSVLPLLEKVGRPVVWMAGADDTRYVSVARRAAEECSNVEALVIDGVGHRIIFEDPSSVAEGIISLLGDPV